LHSFSPELYRTVVCLNGSDVNEVLADAAAAASDTAQIIEADKTRRFPYQ
jgi:hypothetical protein